MLFLAKFSFTSQDVSPSAYTTPVSLLVRRSVRLKPECEEYPALAYRNAFAHDLAF
jgi:hypothetical protein